MNTAFGRTGWLVWAVALCWIYADARSATAAPRTWIGLDGTWVDGAGNNANWSGSDEPDTDDEAIFNSNNVINLGSANSILALTMSASVEVNLNNNVLDVAGLTSLTGSGTRLEISAATAALNGQNISISNIAAVFLDGGTINSSIAGASTAVISTASSGVLSGNGEVSLPESIAATTTVINNNGSIVASNPSQIIFTPPAAATLHLSAADADARIDLDGSLETGVVSVERNQTLDIDIPIFDIFNGGITMSQNTKLDLSSTWTLGALATIDIDNGASGGIPAVPAGTATIAGGAFSQNSGTITVLDTDGTLQFDAPFTMNGGTLTNNGLVVFNSSTTIAAAANFVMPTTSSSLTVAANRTVNINQNNFNLDGSNAATNVITVNDDATLNINTTDYDPDSATNVFDGTVNLVSGTIDITTGDAEFVMDGVLNASASGSNQSLWTGEALDIGNDAGVLDADVNITGSQPTQFGAQVDFNSDADLDVADGATAHFLDTVNFNSVNGGNNAEFTGSGELIFSAGVNFSEATHLNMVGGTVDLDGADSIGDTINVDAPLTIHAELMRSFGKNNGGGGTNLLDVNNSVNTGVLTVNLDDVDAEWTLNAQGVITLVNDATAATLLAGSDLNVNGTLTVAGDVRTTARLDIAGTVNINTAAEPLRLAGGNETTDPNTIAGGTVNGAGILGADTGKALYGFGTINTQIDFDGSSDLMADNGTLNVDGTKILDVETLGTADVDGVLNVANAWNNNVTAGVQLRGGTLSGGTMTNDTISGISGHGLVTARVINNTQLFASFESTLVFQTAANDNDWDGTTNLGEVEAISGNIELRDVGAPFAFGGTVSATNGHRAFTNGFGFNFSPGSTLILATGGKFESTASTDLGGTVTVGVGGATIQVENNSFLEFKSTSATTLGSNLTLKNNNIIIEAGATFSGAGALIVPDGSHLVADNLANIGVLLDMEGAFRPGNSEVIGRVNLFDYQQTNTSELFVELTGTGLNQFDRLVASGDVIVDGFLSIDIDGAFVPALGNTFNIITGSSVTGVFDYADVSGMPAGLTFHINYLVNAVQLQVVPKPFFAADFDDDGDVDATDLAIWTGAFNLNQLGDADGDNDSDGADLIIWQRQFGSHPGAGTGSIIPEPGSIVLLSAMFLTMSMCRGRRRSPRVTAVVVCGALLLATAGISQAQSVSLSLDLLYNNPTNHAQGGAWLLMAKTASPNGISEINAIMSNIDVAGVSYGSSIGAMLKAGNPFVTNNGTSVEVLYAQNISAPASVITDVGRGAGTPGNVALDPLGDGSWNDAALIAKGTFGASKPAFVPNSDTPPDVTDANLLTTKTAPFSTVAGTPLSTIVRESTRPLGDYNQNGTVDTADYTVWRDTMGTNVSLYNGADGNGNGVVDGGDYVVWSAHFGQVASAGSAAMVPEPSALVLAMGMLLGLAGIQFRQHR